MQAMPKWANACFLINAMPQELAKVNAVVQAHGLPRTHAFSALVSWAPVPAGPCQLNSARELRGSAGWSLQSSSIGCAKTAPIAHSRCGRNAAGAEWIAMIPRVLSI